uniref:FAM192A/Fyv6 N-terminal domain-containing protein n=1 Tax=Homalodisca liturata TaxID=320908 RepID=A0A1B6J2L6_9HEMI
MSSGFISETEIAEKRRIRQEEWEKVRKPDQPLEVPDEEYDHRSLFERLQEQKQRKEFEFEEAHRLKHMIKGLDDDEIEFLDLVDRSKLEEERKKSIEEEREIADFRNKVLSLQEHSLEQRIQQEIKAKPPPPPSNSGRPSQMRLLAGAVVKKRSSDGLNTSPKKQKTESETENILNGDQKLDSNSQQQNESSKRPRAEANDSKVEIPLHCIGILPGITSYEDSSDSASSDTDSETTHTKFDLLGRKVCRKRASVSASQ